jgi:hypothetical protein
MDPYSAKEFEQFDERLSTIDMLTWSCIQPRINSRKLLIMHTEQTPQQIDARGRAISFFIVPYLEDKEKCELINSVNFLKYYNHRFRVKIKFSGDTNTLRKPLNMVCKSSNYGVCKTSKYNV